MAIYGELTIGIFNGNLSRSSLARTYIIDLADTMKS